MLIDFNTVVTKYGSPLGIIHVGAHLMEERDGYLSNGVSNIIWIEANPKIYAHLLGRELPEQEKIFNYAICDKDNILYDLNVTNNGMSSSILELEKHKIHHPNIFVICTEKTLSRRIDTLFTEHSLNIDLYDLLVIDIQGVELLALKGCGDLLNKIKYIYTEVNSAHLYKDCSLITEIDEYLLSYNFIRTETSMTPFEWGDALYTKKRV